MSKINVNIISFWFGKITENDLDGDFESCDHFFEDYTSCWCKPEIIFVDPISGRKVVLHRMLFH